MTEDGYTGLFEEDSKRAWPPRGAIGEYDKVELSINREEELYYTFGNTLTEAPRVILACGVFNSRFQLEFQSCLYSTVYCGVGC